MSTWGIQTDLEFIDIAKLTEGDIAVIFEIRDDIIRIENMKCPNRALLSAFCAYLHIRTIGLETKRSINDELH